MFRKLLVLLLVIGSFFGGRIGWGQNGFDASDPLQRKLDELQKKAASVDAREIPFEEKRHFPFRKTPIAVEGILRTGAGRGISISYPKNRTVILYDEKGILMRRIAKNGSFRERSPDIDSSNTIALLGAAFNFDQEKLRRAFTMTWKENDAGWEILMEPRDPEEKKLENVAISGQGLVVDSIVMRFADQKRIEIHPKGETGKVRFTEEEEAVYFRGENG